MLLVLTWISPRGSRSKLSAAESLSGAYEERLAACNPLETLPYPTESALLAALQKNPSRTRPVLILLDSQGRQHSSEQLAGLIRNHQDRGTQRLVFAIGPADGWSAAARARADLQLSFGPMTLPHELARIVLTEQLYRAFTILSGHPYHTGH